MSREQSPSRHSQVKVTAVINSDRSEVSVENDGHTSVSRMKTTQSPSGRTRTMVRRQRVSASLLIVNLTCSRQVIMTSLMQLVRVMLVTSKVAETSETILLLLELIDMRN